MYKQGSPSETVHWDTFSCNDWVKHNNHGDYAQRHTYKHPQANTANINVTIVVGLSLCLLMLLACISRTEWEGILDVRK